MFTAKLKPFSPPQSFRELECCITRGNDCLELCYTLSGELSDIELTKTKQTGLRLSKLWEHTCFELFVKQQGEVAYTEYNLSLSGAWNAYSFTAYRQNMTECETKAPLISSSATEANQLKVKATCYLPSALKTAPLEIAISVVIKTSSAIEYWALRHPAEKPDFHHTQSFYTFK